MITNSSRSLSTLVALSSLKISSALSAVTFELDSLERESEEDSTTPCGVKGVVGPGSRAQIRLAVEKTECPLQRTTTQMTAITRLMWHIT